MKVVVVAGTHSGVGKTTMLREVARVLAEELGKRVVVVDTSNEIAGDGDIPHEGIGRARRMMVPTPELQHRVMIEAVENHTPEAVIIDEIGTSLEALAARTISSSTSLCRRRRRRSRCRLAHSAADSATAAATRSDDAARLLFWLAGAPRARPR